jgi:ligand-binding sensor domain-containing protein/signal transduction histidine kinase
MLVSLSPFKRHAALRLLVLTWSFVCVSSFTASAQKYSFTHYDIEDGLVQSQANTLSQDTAHRLWIGTLGGACLFDGKDFTPLSKENGLVNNFIYKVFSDSRGRTWFGSNEGLSCLDGKKLTNYPIPRNIKKKWVTNIVEDKTGTIWSTMQGNLYKATANGPQRVPIPGFDGCAISCITTDRTGKLCVVIHQKGVFILSANKWINIIPLTGESEKLSVKSIIFDRINASKAYLVANQQLFISNQGRVSPHPVIGLPNIKSTILCAEQDAEGNLWAGAANGAYCLKNNQLRYFQTKNGFTDASVSTIYCDKDNNLWLGTWGAGIYRYNGDDCVLYDHSQGISSFQTIMGMAVDDDQNIWLAAEGSGAIKYDGKTFKNITLTAKWGNVKKPQSIYNDKKGNIWIGSRGNGIWRYSKGKYAMVPGTDRYTTNALLADDDGTIWAATPFGCLYIKNDVVSHVIDFYSFASSLYKIGPDSILVGSQNGVNLIVNKKLVPGFKIKELDQSNIFCILKYQNKILFGTADWGLFVWDKKTGSITNYSVKNGFNSNTIYNMAVDDKGIIWAGTGRGVNRIAPAAKGAGFIVTNYQNPGGIVAEANQNSVVYTNGKLWMGTTKGLLVYNTSASSQPASAPFMLIQSVKLFKGDTASLITDIRKAKLPHNQNHLTISFSGIYLKNPKDVLYQYKLAGYDDDFCQPVKNNMVDYPSLPYGEYTFQVRAITSDGVKSVNTAQFTFEITRPFYRTSFFRALLLLLFIFMGIRVQIFLNRRKQKSQNLIEQLRREEKQNIRRQTAEDFHDDLGNKLTRITVLSDILNTRLADDHIEQKNLVNQIKQNAEALYTGTKDILWALDPKSDNLYEILTHIRLFGTEFFEDTPIKFIFREIDPALKMIKVPMEYNRNITKIYKELLNNALKHSGATEACLQVHVINKAEVDIVLTDNGKGFNANTHSDGNGIKNIYSRAARIGSHISIQPAQGAGTQVNLKLNFKKNLTKSG